MTIRALAALALLLVVALAVPTVLADDPDAPLGPTQIAGDLPPPETDGTAIIQWGGGSLYQLTARLAVNGCDLNLLWVYDDQTQRYTAGYTFDGPSFLNAPFERLYGDGIPPTTLWIKCINMIEHVYGYALLSEEQQKEVDAESKGQDFDLSNYHNLTDCGDHWRQETRELVLPILPVLQNICLIYLDPDHYRGGSYFSGFGPFWKSFVHFIRPSVFVTKSDTATTPPITEFHELCHSNQHWIRLKTVLSYDNIAVAMPDDRVRLYNSWNEYGTAYFSDFLRLTGFKQDEEEGWSLPSDTIYKEGEIYGTHSPNEFLRPMRRILGDKGANRSNLD